MAVRAPTNRAEKRKRRNTRALQTLRPIRNRCSQLILPALDTGPAFCYQHSVRRELLKDISRIVVKLGTGVLTDNRKQPDYAQMERLVAQIAEQRKAGKELLLVSSGAVGAGMGVFGQEKRPNDLAEL